MIGNVAVKTHVTKLGQSHPRSPIAWPKKYTRCLIGAEEADISRIKAGHQPHRSVMVSVSKLVNSGILLITQSVYQDVATPEQAAVEQYNIIKYLGGAAPYIQHQGFGISSDTPDQCEVTQVQLLSRHNARYPTKNKGKDFQKTLELLRANGELKGDLAFVNDYEYFVTDETQYERETTPQNAEGSYIGTTDAYRHGASFRNRYNHLYKENQTLPIFTTNSERVYITSRYFARGFLGDSYSDAIVKYSVFTEDGSLAGNSLTPRHGCEAYDKKVNDELLEQYPRDYVDLILSRWKEQNGDSFEFDEDYITYLFDFCAYELNVKGQSQFCDLFTNDEYVSFGYEQNIGSYYSTGPGNNVSKIAGSPLLEASLKLLEDDDAENKIWLSFSHDTDLDTYLGALGLFTEDLPVDHVDFYAKYTHATLIPQGARFYTEKLSCNGTQYVRYVINDAVIPIPGCQSGPGFSCEFGDFKDYVAAQLDGVSYAEQCDVAEGAPTEVTFYWDYAEKNYTAELEVS